MLVKTLIAVLCVAVATANNHCSRPNDNWPNKCGPRFCPNEESECIDGQCVCKNGQVGQNEMLCVPDSAWSFASVINDPKANIMNNRAGADLPVPCMYLYSHIQTDMKGNMFQGAKCDIKVFLYNVRVDGKLYVGGYRIYVKTSNVPHQMFNKDLVYSVDGEADAGGYCYERSLSKNGGDSYTENFNGNDVKIGISPTVYSIDKNSNRVKLQIGGCGFTAQFRPADKTKKVSEQDWLPGFAMMVDAEQNPTFHSSDKVVSMVPSDGLGDLPVGRGLQEDLVHRAFRGPGVAMSNYPNNSPQCQQTRRKFNACPSEQARTEALFECKWILGTPLFIKCFSEDSSGNLAPDGPGGVNRILDIYKRCIDYNCQKDETKCQRFRGILQNMDPSCKEKISPEKLEPSCDYPPPF